MNARSRAESHRSLLKLDLRASGRFPARAESLSLVLWNRRIERPSMNAASSAPDQSEPESIRRGFDRSLSVYITSTVCLPRVVLNSSSSAVVPAFFRWLPERACTSTGACVGVATVNGVYPLIQAIHSAAAFSFHFIARLMSISLG